MRLGAFGCEPFVGLAVSGDTESDGGGEEEDAAGDGGRGGGFDGNENELDGGVVGAAFPRNLSECLSAAFLARLNKLFFFEFVIVGNPSAG